MGSYYPCSLTTRRITYKLQTTDTRKYLLSSTLQLARNAVTRAGGELLGGTFTPRKHIRRWCVNRSPHVNKTSREHFWMITHRRVFRWDAGVNVDRDAPVEIGCMLPASVALRVQMDVPGLQHLANVFQTVQGISTRVVAEEVDDASDGTEKKEKEEEEK